MLGAILGAGGSLLNAGTNIYNSVKQNEMNQQNLALQKDAFAWQKQAQQTAWDREDNAIQRRAVDLEKAGMNRLLATGQAAQSSSPISLQAPQGQASRMPDLAQSLGMATALMQASADVSRTKADTIVSQIEAVKRAKEASLLDTQQAKYLADIAFVNAQTQTEDERKNQVKADVRRTNQVSDIADSDYAMTARAGKTSKESVAPTGFIGNLIDGARAFAHESNVFLGALIDGGKNLIKPRKPKKPK